MFIDETSTKTNMAPLRGWPPKGKRLPGRAPYGYWNAMTFLAALRHDRIDAPFLLEGPVNHESFFAYVTQALAPTLSPGDVIVADNLACHKHPDVRRALQAVGAKRLLLPKHSPDLNPIKLVFAKLKHLLRKAQAQTQHGACTTIGQLIASRTPQECANSLNNSGCRHRERCSC